MAMRTVDDKGTKSLLFYTKKTHLLLKDQQLAGKGIVTVSCAEKSRRWRANEKEGRSFSTTELAGPVDLAQQVQAVMEKTCSSGPRVHAGNYPDLWVWLSVKHFALHLARYFGIVCRFF